MGHAVLIQQVSQGDLIHSPDNLGRGHRQCQDGRDLHVFDEVYFWFNGQGIRNKLRNSLIVYDPEKEASKIKDDGSAWDRIPTKIRMDEVISTDIINPEGGVQDESDKPKTR